jgi:hypothetical protein
MTIAAGVHVARFGRNMKKKRWEFKGNLMRRLWRRRLGDVLGKPYRGRN